MIPPLRSERSGQISGWLPTRPEDAVLVGDAYAFLRYRKAETLLEGYYVNANSGEVEYRHSPWPLMGVLSKTRRRVEPSHWTTIEKIPTPEQVDSRD